MLKNKSMTANKAMESDAPQLSKSTSKRILFQTRRTPNRTPHRRYAHNASKTPSSVERCVQTTPGADRFMPSRITSNFELAHHKLQSEETVIKEKERILSKKLFGDDIETMRIFGYKDRSDTHSETRKVIYTQEKNSFRHIPQVPEKILDAPGLVNDFYLNLVDWSSTNMIAVALGDSVYLWNANSGDTTQLMQLQGELVTSVSWTTCGTSIAVGTNSGTIQLWDLERRKCLRVLHEHPSRVGCLSWNSYILSSGSHCGEIRHSDVRIANHYLCSSLGHEQEVCGLKWTVSGNYLASGGNDNIINIWSLATSGRTLHSSTTPVYTFSEHKSAVKALAWCPWKTNILASGGGLRDKAIRFWDINVGTCMKTIDAKSEVSDILWLPAYQELISAHGLPDNQLIVWKYSTMTKVADLMGHSNRVLCLSKSPDANVILSLGADEAIRLWKFCLPEKYEKNNESSNLSGVSRLFDQTIR